jgi:hypothetical protein
MLHQCVVFCNKLLQTIFTCTKLHSTNQSVEVGLTGEHMKTCDECETVKHCLEHGCVPKQPALVSKDEALKLALEALINHEGNYKLEKAGAARSHKAITAIKQALAAPAQEFVCSTGLCHYKPAAPDLQAELDATNKQVEILSDALAESRREVAALKAVQDTDAHYKGVVEGVQKLFDDKRAQPAVPDAIGPNDDELPAYAAGWNDCRQAMLEMMK